MADAKEEVKLFAMDDSETMQSFVIECTIVYYSKVIIKEALELKETDAGEKELLEHVLVSCNYSLTLIHCGR